MNDAELGREIREFMESNPDLIADVRQQVDQFITGDGLNAALVAEAKDAVCKAAKAVIGTMHLSEPTKKEAAYQSLMDAVDALIQAEASGQS